MTIGTAPAFLNAQSIPPAAQSRPEQGRGTKQATAQKIDADYTARIKEALQDPRITTELVGHLPASDTVPLRSRSWAAMSASPAS